jgi:hypothetical protein
MQDLSILKKAKAHILSLAEAEKINTQKSDQNRVFKMILRHYNYDSFINKIQIIENAIHNITLEKQELSELEKHVDNKQTKNDSCEIVLDEVNFLHVKLINHVNS